MSAERPRRAPRSRWSGRWLLLAGVAGLALSVVTIVISSAQLQAGLIEGFYRIDPHTGYVESSPAQRWAVGGSAMSDYIIQLTQLSCVALVCMLACIVGLRRMARVRHVPMLLMLAPVLVPLTLGLAAGLLNHGRYHETLAWLHQLVSDEALHGIPHSCIARLQPCSWLLAIDSVWLLTAAAMSLSAVLLIPAATAAWAAGERGVMLGRGWSRAAIAMFVLGALALVTTRAHREDRARTLALCAGPESPQLERSPLRPNLSSLELEGIPVQGRRLELWPSEHPGTATGRVDAAGAYQLFEDGELASMVQIHSGRAATLIDADQLADELVEGVEKARNIADMRGEESFVVVYLYADARAPAAALGWVLDGVAKIGIDEVILLGTGLVPGRLATVGAWARRIHEPIARLRLRAPQNPALKPSRTADAEPGHALEEFETVAELANLANLTGREGLLLQL